MSNLIKIRRSSSNATLGSNNPQLSNGELAWTEAGNVLFIGAYGGTNNIPIAGARTPGILTANQALVVNSTSGIDKLLTSNLTLSSVSVSIINTVANSTVLGAASNAELTSTWSIKTYVDGKVAGAAGSPGGANTQVQFNDSGTFAGDATLTWDKGAKVLLLGNSTVNNALTSAALNLNGGAIVVNSLGAFIGGNVNVGLSGWVIGNSTVNAFSNSSSFTFNAGAVVVNNSVVAVGANNTLSMSQLFVGNSTANVTLGNTGLTSTGNSTTLATMTVNNAGLFIGNSTSTATGLKINLANSSTQANLTPLDLTIGSTVVNSSTVQVGGATVKANSTTISTQDLVVGGNLIINGTLTTIDTTNLTVNDSIIEIARNNSANTIDIGLFGDYSDGTARALGLIWDTSNNAFELFANTVTKPTTTLDPTATGYVRGKLNAFFRAGGGTGIFEANSTGVTITANSTWAAAITANSLSLSSPLSTASGGTNNNITVAAGDILYGVSAGIVNGFAIGTTAGYVLQTTGSTLSWNFLDGGTF